MRKLSCLLALAVAFAALVHNEVAFAKPSRWVAQRLHNVSLDDGTQKFTVEAAWHIYQGGIGTYRTSDRIRISVYQQKKGRLVLLRRKFFSGYVRISECRLITHTPSRQKLLAMHVEAGRYMSSMVFFINPKTFRAQSLLERPVIDMSGRGYDDLAQGILREYTADQYVDKLPRGYKRRAPHVFEGFVRNWLYDAKHKRFIPQSYKPEESSPKRESKTIEGQNHDEILDIRSVVDWRVGVCGMGGRETGDGAPVGR